MNKTIYMTYKNKIPDFVYSRWEKLNKEYKVEFSLDEDCINFLRTNFNDYLAELFISIPVGAYKADLWRLCKLYINGGIYADIDLVPYINIDELDKNITFYSCMAIYEFGIFQAFMINFSKPKNPLILNFLLSFLMNVADNPNKILAHPTSDMLNCIRYNLNNTCVETDKRYDIQEVKIKINIGTSKTNNKNIDLHFFPENIDYEIKIVEHKTIDKFDFILRNNILSVTRTDANCGWGYNHSLNIIIKSKESIYLFKENIGPNDNWVTSYVTFNNKKILDSRDLNYYNEKGWNVKDL